MSFTKLKQATVALMALGMLTACGSNTDKIVETIKTEVQADEAAVAQLQTTMTSQADFMDSFDDLLKDAAKKYEKVEEVLADMQAQATTLKTGFESAQASLTFDENEEAKLTKMLAKAEKEENYENASKLVEAYQTYRTNLEALSTNNVELMSKYEDFLGQITGDMEFQVLEDLIGGLNKVLGTVQKSYDDYTASAQEFQTLLMDSQSAE